ARPRFPRWPLRVRPASRINRARVAACRSSKRRRIFEMPAPRPDELFRPITAADLIRVICMGRRLGSLEGVQAVIQNLYGCDSVHVESVSIRESCEGTEWEGTVEVFSLVGHPTATIAYAWCRESLFVTALAVGRIRTPLDAVRAEIAADIAA